MLASARRTPKACLSCRSQLLALFEYGFTRPSLRKVIRPRLKDENGKRLYSTNLKCPDGTVSRSFSTGRVRLNKDAGDSDGAATSKQEKPPGLEVQRNENPQEITNFERELAGDMSDEIALDLLDDELEKKNYEFGLEFAEELLAAEKEARTERGVEMVVRSARENFGDILPDGLLTPNESVVYERLYGKPAKIVEDDEAEQNALFRENEEGVLEEVAYNSDIDLEDTDPAGIYIGEAPDTQEDVANYRTRKSKRKKDLEAKWQYNLEREVAEALAANRGASDDGVEQEYGEEAAEETGVGEEDEEEFISGDARRTHPNTKAGRFGTYPSTIYLPKETLVNPISELISRTHQKHLLEAAHRAFGGPRVPHSASTPKIKHQPNQKHIGLEAGQHRMSEVEADAYLACVLPATYATVSSVLVETRKRLGRSWLTDLMNQPEGPRILDAGGGGAGILAWHEVVEAEWESLKEDGLVEKDKDVPSGRQTVLVSSSTLRHRMSTMLENTTFLPRLPDYLHASNPEVTLDGDGGVVEERKKFDVIIAPHTLLPLRDERRKRYVENLWSLLNPEGGVLILIEKGMPIGFEAIAGARSMLLKNHIASPNDSTIENQLSEHDSKGQYTEKEKAMIVAPCTNHTKCPMYKIEGHNPGRKDFCHFNQRFIRPPFLQNIVGARSINHEDVQFSYLVVQRGVDLRPSYEIQVPEGKGDKSQQEVVTDAAFAGYEFPWTMPDELAVEKAPEIQRQEMAEYERTHPPFSPFNLPRAVLPPIKASGHVTLDLCTPRGNIERWIVSKAFSRQAYRDARKSKWGDLWALGAKTRVLREPRLGRKGADKGGKGGKGKRKDKVDRFNVIMGEDGMEEVREVVGRRAREGRRTKGGRRNQLPREIGEDD